MGIRCHPLGLSGSFSRARPASWSTRIMLSGNVIDPNCSAWT